MAATAGSSSHRLRARLVVAIVLAPAIFVAACTGDTAPGQQPDPTSAVTASAPATAAGLARRQFATAHVETALSPPAFPAGATPGLPAPTAAPTPLPTPATPFRVTAAAGTVIDTTRAVFFVDPRDGSAEGWRIPAHPTAVPITQFIVSPFGRYFVYGDRYDAKRATFDWFLFDTRSETVSELPPLSERGVFSPDERWYAIPGWDRVIIVRTADGTVERTIPLDGFAPVDEPTRGSRIGTSIGWNPTGTSLAIALLRRSDGRGWRKTITLYHLATDRFERVIDGEDLSFQWFPDGRHYLLTTGSDIAAFHATSGTLLWRTLAAALLELFGELPPAPPGELAAPGVQQPIISPNGALILVESGMRWIDGFGFPVQLRSRLLLLDAETGTPRLAVDDATPCPPGSWTADSRRLVVLGYIGDRYGMVAIRVDGQDIRYIHLNIHGLSPVVASLGGSQSHDGIELYDLLTGVLRRTIRLSGASGWDFLHQPLWLRDGRILLHAHHGGHGGCGGLSPPDGPITIRWR